jgi:hypothetical protein
LYAVHRFYLPLRRRGKNKNGSLLLNTDNNGQLIEKKEYILCPKGYTALLNRRFEEAIDCFLEFVRCDPDSLVIVAADNDDDYKEEEIGSVFMPKKTRLTSDLTFDPTRKMATVRRTVDERKRAATSCRYSFSLDSLQQQQKQIPKKPQSKLLLPSEAASSSLAATYRSLAFQTLADQVKSSVRTHPGNEWMFCVTNVEGQMLRFCNELVVGRDDLMLLEKTPVRMDLSHSW